MYCKALTTATKCSNFQYSAPSSLENYTSNNTTQHDTTKVQCNTTRVYYGTSRGQQDTTTNNTSATRERQHDTTTHHKFHFDLYTSLPHTRKLVS